MTQAAAPAPPSLSNAESIVDEPPIDLAEELQAAKRSYRDESSEAMGRLRARRLAFDESVAEQIYDITLALNELEAVAEATQ